MCEGEAIREKATIRREAGWVAHLMNATGNFADSPITIEHLVGGEDRKKEHDEEQRVMQERAEKRRAERLKAREAKQRGG